MKVIFLEDDRIAEVSDGHARNYLFPHRLAVIATPGATAAAQKRAEQRKVELEQRRAEMQALAEKLGEQETVIAVDAGEGGKLFGSVTSADIADAVKKSSGIDIDRKKITLTDPIKLVGEYKVPLKLFHDVTAVLKINITAK